MYFESPILDTENQVLVGCFCKERSVAARLGRHSHFARNPAIKEAFLGRRTPCLSRPAKYERADGISIDLVNPRKVGLGGGRLPLASGVFSSRRFLLPSRFFKVPFQVVPEHFECHPRLSSVLKFSPFLLI